MNAISFPDQPQPQPDFVISLGKIIQGTEPKAESIIYGARFTNRDAAKTYAVLYEKEGWGCNESHCVNGWGQPIKAPSPWGISFRLTGAFFTRREDAALWMKWEICTAAANALASLEGEGSEEEGAEG